MKNKKHMHPNDLSDEVLEKCFDGSTSTLLVREIIIKMNVLRADNTIDMAAFGRNFMYALEGYTDGDEDANENNFDWGVDIAMRINEETKQ